MLDKRWAREAAEQLSSRVAKITALRGGRCDVLLPNGRTMKAIHFAMGVTLPINTWVQIERVGQDWQVIGFGMAFTSTPVTPPVPPEVLTLGLWSQPEAGAELAYFAASDIVNPDGTSNLLFGGGALGGSDYFGITVDAEGRLTFAQMLRDAGDTFWEKMRLIDLAIDNSTALVTECLIDESPIFATNGETFISGDRSFTLIINPAAHQLFRRNNFFFQQITLTDIEDLALTKASVSPLGYLAIPSYGRHGVDEYYAAYPLYGETYTEVTVDYNHRVNGWMTKSEVPAQPRLWSREIGFNLEYAKKRIFANLGRNRMPISKDGQIMVAWVSGAQVMDSGNEPHQMLDGYRRFNSFPLTLSYRTDISRELKACVIGLSASTGDAVWRYTITAPATLAIADGGILGPIETYMSTLSGFDFGDNGDTVYGGRAEHLAHTSNGFSPFTTIKAPTGYGTGIDYPDYGYFTRTAIIGLPKPQDNDGDGDNNTRPRYVLGALDTLAVFGDYLKTADVSYDSPQSPQFVEDEEGNIYFAYLKPVSYLTPGKAGIIGVTRFNEWRGLLEGTYDVPVDDEVGSQVDPVVYHTPGMINCGRRYIVKLSPTGGLMALSEVVQEYNASWYEETDQVNLSLEPGFDVLGGDSAELWPLGDQLWGNYPCGRVVFTFLDYHDLGPTLGPACKLEIRSSSNLSVLHTIELRSGEDVTTTDTYELIVENVGVGDGVTTNFTLIQTVSEIVSARIDGVDEPGFTQVGNSIEFGTAPPDLSFVEVTYRNGTVAFYAGARRYQVKGRSTAIRTGQRDSGWKEWALLWVTETDITTGVDTSRRILIAMDETDETIAPTITYPTNNPPSNTTVVSSGLLLTPSNIGIGIITATG